jgi:hypothetical protein
MPGAANAIAAVRGARRADWTYGLTTAGAPSWPGEDGLAEQAKQDFMPGLAGRPHRAQNAILDRVLYVDVFTVSIHTDTLSALPR